MTPRSPLPASFAVLLAAAAPVLPARADSLASSASSAASESVGSSSTSIQRSSDSSSKDRRVAQGDYRVVARTADPARPGQERLQLQGPGGAQDAFTLLLPQTAAAGIVAGQLVSVRERPYGLEFAQAGQAFFLVLDDAWQRELQTRPVRL